MQTSPAAAARSHRARWQLSEGQYPARAALQAGQGRLRTASAWIHRLNAGGRFFADEAGMLTLGLMAGVDFLPLTFLRLVRGFVLGSGLAVCRGHLGRGGR
jgi:hypothetical protein